MKYLFTLLLLGTSLLTFGQDQEQEAVINTIKQMFDGMRAGDSAMVSAVFVADAGMFTVFTDKNGDAQRRQGSLQNFLNAVGTPHDKVWDEKIWSYKVKIDGVLATAWTEYTFYHGGELSHCGVNAFNLFKSNDGWKIINVTDTRRKSNCIEDQTPTVNQFLDDWHKAAATADEDTFFGSMTQDGIYIGTDASERWLRDELKEWSAKYFDRESAWSFTPIERTITFSDDYSLAWFDELLDTWMGTCRASGVVQYINGEWKIKHYHLSIAVPNDAVDSYLKVLKKMEKKGKK